MCVTIKAVNIKLSIPQASRFIGQTAVLLHSFIKYFDNTNIQLPKS